MGKIDEKQGLTVMSLLLMAIVEKGDPEDIRKASMGVAHFPMDIADKYWDDSINIAKMFAGIKLEGEIQ